ncbi:MULTISPECIES: DNA polymerase III subunit epsilon [unclassified Motilimonas]|uniref:DNA polymerase III subunit epsilon n=1 Tax=Motilimonas TaxID=1914248 RepID=UPI001E3E55FB|nr:MULTISPECIES: DNA polymerase III subunit epsilon [unclassified Motilimonas]MCE0556683.1 DNA polymerase III subunit epsilon [Motilimonas sp. E26]MDO6528069.1 DNA polymerase III subunit epsilon [Motilimonas sp. 1_MG-2023]
MNTEQTLRQVVLDTETTGMNFDAGPHYLNHSIIEIGCVELVNRRLTGRHYHVYIKPDRKIDAEAIGVHGITDAFLRDKPSFSQIAPEFIEFIKGAEIIAHNAPFDVGFMNYEFDKLKTGVGKTEDFCKVTDTLQMAKEIFPGKRNNLDVLCDRYGIDNSHRTLHGALLDAEILADVYLLMTGGQTALNLSQESDSQQQSNQQGIKRLAANRAPLKVLSADADELVAHQERLQLIAKKGTCLWLD